MPPKRMAIWLMGLLAGSSLAAVGLAADGGKPDKKPVSPVKAPPPDVKFLEYLGSLEGEGENWTDVVAADLLEQNKGASKAKTVAKPVEKK